MQRHALPIAVLVLLVLLGWLWLLERDPPTPAAEPPPTSQPLWTDFDADTVRALSIRDKGDRGVQLERSGDGWLATLPEHDGQRRANEDLADAAAGAVAALASNKTLESTGASPADYGLGSEALTVTVQLTGGDSRTLRIGDPLTVAHGHYAQVQGEAVVHVISSAPLIALTRDPLDYRDRRVLPLAPDEIDAVTSELSDPPLSLERRGRSWVLEPGPGGRADENLVASLLDGLSLLGGRSWEPTETEPVGPRVLLQTPRGEVVLQLMSPLPTEAPTTVRVRVRGPLPPPLDDDLVVTIPGDGLSDLLVPAADWRSTELVELNPWLVTSFTWSAGGTEWTFDHTEDGWLGPSEQDARPGVGSERVQTFLQAVDGLRGVAWLPEDDAPSGLVETASLTGVHKDGSTFGLTLLRGPSRDYARAEGELGIREIDGTANDLLGTLRALPEVP